MASGILPVHDRRPPGCYGSSHLAFQADRPSNVFDGHLVLAHLVSNHAEKMNRIGLIRLDRKICR